MRRTLVVTWFLCAACGSRGDGMPNTGDDAGAVLDCTRDSDCTGSRVCDQNRCVPGNCTDSELNGNESDTDCGGDCVPCSEGNQCTGEADCASRYCDGFSVCRDCVNDDQCDAAEGTFCDQGTCVVDAADGASCERDAQCVSEICSAEGVCCDVECGGTCAEGACIPPAVVVNFVADDCIANLTNPVTAPASTDMQLCVYGMPPGTATLGTANSGDLPCESPAVGTYVELLGADGWSYEQARSVWQGAIPSTTFGPGVTFTLCWKNANTGAFLKRYVEIATP